MVTYIHPLMGHTTESMQRSMYIHLAVFTPLATLIVATRLYVRIAGKKAGWDDLLISISWAFATVHTCLVINEIKHGLGKHIEDIPFPDFEKLMKAFYFILISYTAAIGCFKMSVLVQYLRIFPSQTFRYVCFGTLTVVAMFTLSFIFTAIFQCQPVRFFWARMIPGGSCMDPAKVWVTMNSINIATDLFIFVLPLPPLYKLTFPGRMKFALMIVFALGFFVVLMSIFRLPSVYLICTTADLPWYSPSSTIWTIIELNTAVICASMPSLRILGASIIQRFLTTTRRLKTLHMTTKPGSQHLPSDPPSAKAVGTERWANVELFVHDHEKSAADTATTQLSEPVSAGEP